MTSAGNYRVGIDIGGTFTDFVLYDVNGGELALHKRLTSPSDPSRSALLGVQELLDLRGATIGEVDEIVHGTTLVTNAVIERRGAAIGMLTTRGFRDTIEIGTEQRYDIYDLQLVFPEPLVERALRLEIDERISSEGEVVTPLDAQSVLDAAAQLVAEGVEGIAICLINAYRNPAHEQAVRALVQEAYPGLAVSISSEVVAEISEYPRFVTTCANVYVQPLMDRYLKRFASELQAMGFAGAFNLMHSAAGLMSMDEARAFPIRLLESGPAGGARAAAWFARTAGKADVLAFDMGGTTAKACLIEDDRIDIASQLEAGRVHRFKNGSGLPIKAPVVDMIEIGAGGGSIAAMGEVGLLQVGPRSAGAEPGPACYGNGGTEPTVTDASVALGYYDPENLLGGRLPLDRGAATRALEELGAKLGMNEAETAWGIHKVVTENMASAAQIHIVERGRDPRGYAMVSFGGAGPAFAAKVARTLNIAEVIIPPASGAASAFGFLTSPLSQDVVRSLPLMMTEHMDGDRVNAVLAELEAEGRAKLAAAGVAEAEMTVTRSADMQLVGQLHQIGVELPEGTLSGASYPAIRAAFEAIYTARYTAVPNAAQIQALSFRVTVSGPDPKIGATLSGAAKTISETPRTRRQAYFDGQFHDTPVYDRYALPQGIEIVGPAIVEESESTTVVPPGDRLSVDAAGNLCIAVQTASRAEKIVLADTPLDEAIARIEADPISLEIMWSRLVTISEEMWQTVCRTAFSVIIAESQDFACALLDGQGETLAHSTRAMPAFNLSLPGAARAMIERFPVDTLKPGDVLVTNDPWLCAGHLFDIALVTPVFRNGRVVAVLGTVGHVGDIGGTREGYKATEVYEEGIQIPPMKFAREGVENEDLITLLSQNVRDPEQVLGDLRSLIAANETGARRLLQFMDEYGLEDLNALSQVLQSRSEKAMRAAIRTIPNGTYKSEISYNPNGTHMRLPIEVTVTDDEIEVDYPEAPPQVSRGGINCTMSYTTAHTVYPLKCMLTPNVRSNAGCYLPLKVKAPEGSVMNCRYPASVSLRTRTGWYASPILFAAMADAAQERVISATGMPGLVYVYGERSDGTPYYDYLLSGGGQGACAAHDGHASVLFPTSAATSSIEIMESRSPVLITEKSLVTDTGGAGRTRGGLGCRIRLRRRDDNAHPMSVILNPEGVNVTRPGLFGGQQGGLPHGGWRDGAGAALSDIGTGGTIVLADTAQEVEVLIAGGAGYGAPGERSRAQVLDDLRQGYIGAEAARSIYGQDVADKQPAGSVTQGEDA